MTLDALKRGVKRSFATPWVWRTLGPLVRAPGVSVLTYHRIVGDDPSLAGVPVARFVEQMRWIRDHCDPIGPDALRERARTARVGRPAVLVTFDDGYRSYHDLAYPVLKELNIPAVVFLVTELVTNGQMLWTDQVQWAAQSTPSTSISVPWAQGGAELPLDDAAMRRAFGGIARAHLKRLPDAQRRAEVASLLATLKGTFPPQRQMMTWDEVRNTMDLTTYGGHTHTHAILSRLDRAAAEREIITCRDTITREIGRAPIYFAYPNGSPVDYTAETKEIVRAAGFDVSFSASEGIANAASDWLEVKRLPGTDTDLPGFVWTSAGFGTSR